MKAVIISFLVLMTGSVFAQNTMRFSQVNFAQGVNNPAALAIDGTIMADLIFRNQWLGVDGAPTSVAANGQYELNQSMAVGLNMSYDQIGASQTTSFAGQYAYRLYFDYSRALIFGAGIGMDNAVNNLAGAQTTQLGDPAFMNNYSKVYFNSSFGLFYNTPQFYIGASIPKMFSNSPFGNATGIQPKLWHYYMSTGYYFYIGEKFTLNPHIQIKAAVNAPIQGDLIIRNSIMNTFSIVVGYRSENSIIAGFDVRIGGYARIGYSFNYDVGSLARIKGGSNELYVGLAFPYRNSREDFGKRRYYNAKGGHKSDFKQNSARKQKNWNQKKGRFN